MSEDIGNLLKYLIATSLTNQNSSRVQSCSEHRRLEGWTEVFGNRACGVDKKKIGKRGEEKEEVEEEGNDVEDKHGYWEGEDEFVFRNASKQESPPTPISLSQWRVAWQEQLLLRIAGIPHTVHNSPYAATESCGALPSLIDVAAHGNGGGALVGRCTRMNGNGAKGSGPSGGVKRDDGDGSEEKVCLNSKNQIVNYLLEHSNHDIPLPDSKLNKDETAQNYTLTTLINHQLNTILSALRFGNSNAWDDVYRHQAINASIDPDHLLPSAHHAAAAADEEEKRHSRSFHPLSSFQAWSERTIALHGLVDASHTTPHSRLFHRGSREVCLDVALQTARSCYAVLENVLAKQSNVSLSSSDGGEGDSLVGMTLLGTETPALVDTMLFAHLAEALCDVHLVTVLGDYTHLVKFFETMYEVYFGKGYADRWRADNNNNNKKKGSDNTTTTTSTDQNQHDDNDVCWIAYNDLRNVTNRFNRIPSLLPNTHHTGTAVPPPPPPPSSPPMIGKGLQEVLLDGAVQRKEDVRISLINQRKNVGEMMHRLRMGGKMKGTNTNTDRAASGGKAGRGRASGPDGRNDGEKGDAGSDGGEDTDDFTRRNRRHMMKLKKEAKMHDELWISGVIVTTIFGFVLATVNSAGS